MKRNRHLNKKLIKLLYQVKYGYLIYSSHYQHNINVQQLFIKKLIIEIGTSPWEIYMI